MGWKHQLADGLNDARLEVRLPSALLDRLPTGRRRSVFVREALEEKLGASRGTAVPSPEAVAEMSSGTLRAKGDDGAGRAGSIPASPATSTVPPAAAAPTAAQLVGMSRGALTRAGAERALADGSWRRYLS